MDESKLRSVALFADLSRRELRRVAQLADEIDLPAGKPLVRQGTFSYEFFLIEEGAAEVRIHDRQVAELGPGDFFGEIGSLTDNRRNADVTTTSPMTAIVMTARALRTIAGEMPAVSGRLQEAIRERSGAVVDA